MTLYSISEKIYKNNTYKNHTKDNMGMPLCFFSIIEVKTKLSIFNGCRLCRRGEKRWALRPRI